MTPQNSTAMLIQKLEALQGPDDLQSMKFPELKILLVLFVQNTLEFQGEIREDIKTFKSSYVKRDDCDIRHPGREQDSGRPPDDNCNGKRTRDLFYRPLNYIIDGTKTLISFMWNFRLWKFQAKSVYALGLLMLFVSSIVSMIDPESPVALGVFLKNLYGALKGIF